MSRAITERDVATDILVDNRYIRRVHGLSASMASTWNTIYGYPATGGGTWGKLRGRLGHSDGPAYLTDFKIDYAFTDMVDGAITALVKTFVEIASAKMQAPVTWVEEFSVQGGSFVKSESASFIDHFLFKDIKQPPSQNDFSCHTGYFRVE
ncbi:hypothetical protein COCC4DRAFT_66973 [Bipolaris maydis ATCC 48331]|uniref:Uncharacterized protein n=2 Tax=Cochliobolus heterostrophus TaxID=5016 RepID=M2TEI2_COCH5|nr:uncharacterized protein COCC4DRAFT_66973 [Bipolaris maydis ATCC 48331]EMD84934.1 hypothetical protein COCHEDRAFT_1219749 [Bipolaris maydis C5]KAH7563599.1 hypothetical protein BM1_00646 [Bipolaris maydis]ENH98861.1 hypothetical protein COCC4DRAFT_66973 [Bipolaris maydis ATCC 48331]KAJ6269980.1 hypothetical protein PSV08DRAFT_353145 [Bipolaris maydis]KAJ6280211.1 hypothetical protein J3E71DRAFT_343570 [Bipolaris maydis]